MARVNLTFIFIGLMLLCGLGAAKAQARVELDAPYLFHLDEGQQFPSAYAEVPEWMSSLREAPSVKLTGGDYWMVTQLLPHRTDGTWVVDARNSIIENVDYWVLGSDGSSQLAHSGYSAPYEFLFDYGRSFSLTPGIDYWLVVKLSSRYYSSAPQLEMSPLAEHRLLTDQLAMIISLCLGGLVFIACYNLFIYLSTSDKAFLFYGVYVLSYFGGWAFTFHLPAHLWNFHLLELHHLFFIGLPILNIMFYKYFLQLPSYSPKLWRLSKILLWACILALPTSIWLISYTAIIASVLIMFWIALAITCGNVCLMKGFSPARYFILAFSCLLLPAVLILPGNLGITPDFIEYAELATLIGGTADALLLSLALANKLKLLSEERKAHIEELCFAWETARRDALTQVGNRFAFDEFMQGATEFADRVKQAMSLVLLDVDGLKTINETLGHHEGDRVLKSLVQTLQGIQLAHMSLYRLSGDEFAIILPSEEREALLLKINDLKQALLAEGAKGVKLHCGYADNTQVAKSHEWLRLAGSKLYSDKIGKRREKYAQSRALGSEVGY
ncbi:GGDEF domain-containing protein [Shewanella salipaludis]|uniref:diguanylate cyclase n=1 Tax=Shewanella salipaludis TaxID=2723052 RepID=A0A972FR35_9GAMM|nr:GGDEF domain-containing protein [Shewanella salipaludis]NMH64623.1 GGDEF domain-containing protein [Shewanella salipaludis]